MKLSIILATKDRPKFLPYAIESVLAQDDERWELVVLDNGEPVETIVGSELRGRIRYFHREASGPADAFQQALDLATGDVILPMGDDDTLEPHTVRTILDGIGEAEWGYAQTAFLQDKQRRFILGDTWSLERMRQDYYLGGAVFWRRTLTDRLGGFDAAFDSAADYDLYLRFGEDSEPVFIPEVLYLYNDHPGTDSNVNAARQYEAAARIRARSPRRRVAVITPWIGHHELIPFYAQAVERADQVIVIDNGGGPSAELLSPAPSLILTPDQPLGFAASNNFGAAHLDESIDIVVYLNNDVSGLPVWLEAVRADVQDGALYGPEIGRQTLLGITIPYINGWCVVGTRSTWDELDTLPLGPWDEERFPHAYWEDVELSMRAARGGIELKHAPWKLRHIGGVTSATARGMVEAVEAGRRVVQRDLEEALACQA